MPTPTLQLPHGDHSTLLFLSGGVESNSNGLDTFSGRFQGATAAGANLRRGLAVPGFAGITIESVRPETMGAYAIWEVRGRGIEGAVAERVIGQVEPVTSLSDWDTVTITLLTKNSSRYRVGQLLAGDWLGMVCTDVNASHEEGDWYRLRVQGKGLKRAKNPHRRLTCNGQTISFESGRWPVFPGGWNNLRKGVVDLPQITIVDRHWATSRPNTAEVPGSAIPPNAPPLRSLGNIVITGDTNYWPNGWKLTITGAEQLGDSTLWTYERNYTVQWAKLPS